MRSSLLCPWGTCLSCDVNGQFRCFLVCLGNRWTMRRCATSVNNVFAGSRLDVAHIFKLSSKWIWHGMWPVFISIWLSCGGAGVMVHPLEGYSTRLYRSPVISTVDGYEGGVAPGPQATGLRRFHGRAVVQHKWFDPGTPLLGVWPGCGTRIPA